MYRNNAAWSPQSNEILLAHWVSAICLSVLLLLLKVNRLCRSDIYRDAFWRSQVIWKPSQYHFMIFISINNLPNIPTYLLGTWRLTQQYTYCPTQLFFFGALYFTVHFSLKYMLHREYHSSWPKKLPNLIKVTNYQKIAPSSTLVIF